MFQAHVDILTVVYMLTALCRGFNARRGLKRHFQKLYFQRNQRLSSLHPGESFGKQFKESWTGET